MDREEFLLFHNVIAAADIVLGAACMAGFFFPFAEREERGAGRGKRFVLLGLPYLAAYSVNMLTELPVGGWGCMLAVVLVLTACSGYLGMERRTAFLLGILFFCMRYMSVLMPDSLRYLMEKLYLDGASQVEEIYRNAAIAAAAVMAVRYILFWGMLYYAGKKLLRRRLRLHGRELFRLCLIPVAGILFWNIILHLLVVVKGEVYFQLYEEYPFSVGLVPLMGLLLYTGTIVSIIYYQKTECLEEEKRKYFVEQQQLLAMRGRIAEVEQFYDGIRRMKHDMRGHLTNIRGLAAAGRYEDMEEYLSKMDGSLNAFDFAIQTGNAVADVILNDKRKAAVSQGIAFQAEFIYPASKGYDAYDIGIILGNLLQNALEACVQMTEKKRYIVCNGRQSGKFFLITVRNSFAGGVRFDPATGLPLSTKGGDASLHGIGLSNVKREAEKYMGDMEILTEGNEFRVTVLLQERAADSV